MTEFACDRLFDLGGSLAEPLFDGVAYPWEVLPRIGAFVAELAEKLEAMPGWKKLSDGVTVSLDAEIAPSAVIMGPCVIGPGAEVRPGAYIRGKVLVCGGCVVGNSTELKNTVMLEGAKLPHYNYAGDSVIGRGAHMGAAAVASNFKLDGSNIKFQGKDTGLRKFGAILGDRAEVGCHCVLNPGTVIGRYSALYPGTVVRGFVPENSIVKSAENIVLRA